MLCRDDARRKSNVDQEAIKRNYDALTILYCAKCASEHKLPISHRVIVEQDVQPCMICGNEETMCGSLMRDNDLLEGICVRGTSGKTCTIDELIKMKDYAESIEMKPIDGFYHL
jgi:hypothetical protein